MKPVYQILEELRATSSLNAKKAILNENADNEELKKVFLYAYHPRHNYYIRSKKLRIPETSGVATNTKALIQCLDHLKDRKYTGHAAIRHCEEMLSFVSVEMQQLFCRVLDHDLKCGATGSLANKTWGDDFIPEWPCLLAKSDDPKNRAKIKFPAYAQFKSDGMRINVFCRKQDDGSYEITYVSRGGNQMYCNTPLLDGEFSKLAAWYDANGMMFDGELVCREKDGTKMKRQKSNGIGNKCIHNTIPDEEKELLAIDLWDVIPIAIFDGLGESVSYQTRLDSLILALRESQATRIHEIESRIVNSWAEAGEYYKEIVAAGFEGLVVKNSDGLWINDRSPDLVKMKECLEMDLLITGWEFGEKGTQNEHRLGALIAQDKTGLLIASVGGGYSSKQRDEYTPENTIGRIMAVEYNAITKGKNKGTWALSHCNHIEIRLDKTEPDTFVPPKK